MRDRDQTARGARRPADGGLRCGSGRRPSHRRPGRSGRRGGGGGGPPALRPVGRRGLRSRHGHLPRWGRQRGLPDQWVRPFGDPPVRRCDPWRARCLSLCAARARDGVGGLGGGLAVAPARRHDPRCTHAAWTRVCERALRQPLLSRHPSAPRRRIDLCRAGRSPVASGMTVASRLFSRTLLRPGPSLLMLGAAILASNWVWYGSGIFLGQAAGLALTIAGLLGFGYAAYSLVRGRHQLRAFSIFIVAAVLLPALTLIALRSVALAALFLDPFFYFPQGRNDILFLAPLTLGVLAWARGKPRLAALGFGVAFAFKPFALFFLPCVAIALWPRSGPVLDRGRRLAILAAALLAPAALTMGPFLLWNAPVYWTDTVSFVAGTLPGAYRIQGYSLASLLLALHVIPSADARFPFGIVQAAVAVPVLAIGLRRIWRAPSLGAVLSVGTLALTLSLLAGRFVNDNYLADLLYLAVLAGVARQVSAATIAPSRPMPAAA